MGRAPADPADKSDGAGYLGAPEAQGCERRVGDPQAGQGNLFNVRVPKGK